MFQVLCAHLPFVLAHLQYTNSFTITTHPLPRTHHTHHTHHTNNTYTYANTCTHTLNAHNHAHTLFAAQTNKDIDRHTAHQCFFCIYGSACTLFCMFGSASTHSACTVPHPHYSASTYLYNPLPPMYLWPALSDIAHFRISALFQRLALCVSISCPPSTPAPPPIPSRCLTNSGMPRVVRTDCLGGACLAAIYHCLAAIHHSSMPHSRHESFREGRA